MLINQSTAWQGWCGDFITFVILTSVARKDLGLLASLSLKNTQVRYLQ